MDVALWGRRYVVVDDVGEGVDIKPAGGHVGCDKQFGGAVAEAADDPLALGLVHPAVQCLCAVAASVHGRGQLVDLAACSAKNQRRAGRLDVEDTAECRGFVGAQDDVGALTYQRFGRLRVAFADLDADRVSLVAPGDRVDSCGHRRREEHGLALGGRGVQDGLDVVGKAHVEHLVGLVEYDDLDTTKWQRPAPDVVDRSTWCRHNHVHSAVEELQLTADRLAAVDRHNLYPEARAVFEDRLAHLHGQFARRHEHEGHRCWKAPGGGVDVLEDGEREGRGLAGTRGRLAKKVAPGDQRRDRLTLDRCWLLVAEDAKSGERLGTQAEPVEANDRALIIRGRHLSVQLTWSDRRRQRRHPPTLRIRLWRQGERVGALAGGFGHTHPKRQGANQKASDGVRVRRSLGRRAKQELQRLVEVAA